MAVFSIIVLPVVHRKPLKTNIWNILHVTCNCKFVCLPVFFFSLGVSSSQDPLGIIEGGHLLPWVGWPFYLGEIIFKSMIGFGGSFSGVKALTGGSFYKFYESGEKAVTIKRKLIECKSRE